jgi:hypothetical protein
MNKLILMLGFIVPGMALVREKPAIDEGVRAILAANPSVRWAGIVHDPPCMGERWVFYYGGNDLRVQVPKDCTPEGFTLARKAARTAILIWLVQQRQPDYMPHLGPDATPPTALMNMLAVENNKKLGEAFTVIPISIYTSKPDAGIGARLCRK